MVINQVTPPAVAGTYWQWQGQNIYYVPAAESGSNYPPLLLIHGFGACTDHWRKNIAELQSEFPVYAIDLVGFGRSSKPDWTYSGQLWQQQLATFIQDIIGEAVVLVGNSLGGYAAMCVAGNYPELCRGIVLLNSAGPFLDQQRSDHWAETLSWRQRLQKLMRSLLFSRWGSWLLFQYVRRKSMIRRTLQQVYVDQTAVTDQLVEDIYRPSCDRGAAKVFASVFKTPRGETVDQLLQRLEVPLLLLWGEGDPWMDTQARSRKFHQHYNNISEYFLNAGHCPHDEVPQQVNETIKNWMMSQVMNSAMVDEKWE